MTVLIDDGGLQKQIMLKARSRNIFHIFMAALFVLLFSTSTGLGFSRKPPEPEYVPGQVLVKFNDEVSAERIDEIIFEMDCQIIKVLRRVNVHHISLPEDLSVEGAIDRFSDYPEVNYAKPNYKVRALSR